MSFLSAKSLKCLLICLQFSLLKKRVGCNHEIRIISHRELNEFLHTYSWSIRFHYRCLTTKTPLVRNVWCVKDFWMSHSQKYHRKRQPIKEREMDRLTDRQTDRCYHVKPAECFQDTKLSLCGRKISPLSAFLWFGNILLSSIEPVPCNRMERCSASKHTYVLYCTCKILGGIIYAA